MALILTLLTSCRSSSPEGEDQLAPVTRSNIDFILNHPRETQIKNIPLDPESKRAFGLEKAADLVIEFSRDGKLDLGVGRMSLDGARDPQRFNFEELVGFFDDQRHKDMIVVNFHKGAPANGSVESAAKMINGYFKDRGYRRVVICQFRSSSYPIHSDTRFRQ